MHRYRHSGLIVASDIALPEWDAFAWGDMAAPPDVHIVLADDPDPECPADGIAVDCAGTVRFAVPGVGAWQILAGERIVLRPGLAADPREIRLFTLGTAWAALGYQRGHAMWHGSAVTAGGRTMLLCGHAGEGKSTLAAALLACGGTLVADDLSRVEPGAGRALIHPSSARIKLWGEAVDALGWRDRVIERDFMRENKFHCSVPRSTAGERPLALDEMVVLATGERVERTVLEGSDAVTAVLAATVYRPQIIEGLDRWARQGALAARIVAQCRVSCLTRPRDLSRLDEAALVLTR